MHLGSFEPGTSVEPEKSSVSMTKIPDASMTWISRIWMPVAGTSGAAVRGTCGVGLTESCGTLWVTPLLII